MKTLEMRENHRKNGGVSTKLLLSQLPLITNFKTIAIILMGKRELVALLNLSSWCLVTVERLFLAVPRGCLRFVIVVFPDHTHLLFLVPNQSLDNFVLFCYLVSKLSN